MPASGTVIAALRYRDGALIAADSQASDYLAGVKWPVSKLYQVTTLPMVIGFSGSMGAADRLLDRLQASGIRATTLERKERLQNLLDGIFKPEYEAAAKRSLPPDGLPGIVIWGLGVVWAEREARILEYEANADSCWHPHFHAIGSGSTTAYAVFRALGGRELCKLDGPRAELALLRIVRTAIDVDWAGVSEPIRLWRVESTGARAMKDDDVNTNLQLVDEWEAEDRRRLFGSDEEPPSA